MAEMRFRSLTKTIPAVILLMFCLNIWSQVVVERSKDKAVISGVTYYIHQVKKGETAYSISRAYGITLEELTKENPPAVYGLNAGQTIRIPVKSVKDTTVSQSDAAKNKKDESKFIYHILKPGETIYFLSKTYGVSENEILSCNPGIDITKLSVGMGIVVPRKEFMTSREKFDEPAGQPAEVKEKEKAVTPAATAPSAVQTQPQTQPQIQTQPQTQLQTQAQSQDKGYILHKVENGESLSSIAEKYGVSVREMRRANRDLRFPQPGDYVKVPGVKEPEKTMTKTSQPDTVKEIVAPPVLKAERPVGYTPVKELGGSLNVAILLPFYLAENAARMEIDSTRWSKGKKAVKVTTRGDDWIYPGSLDFIEMYEGILLAVDTLRSLGLNINLNTFDIESDTAELTRIISAGKLEGMDLIIGPVYSHNLSIVASYAKNLGIPVVSPVPLLDNSVLTANPVLFLASASLEVAQQKLAARFSEYPDNNFIFVHSDTLGVDEDVQRFRKLILAQLSAKMPYEEIRFREFPFYSRSMFDNDSINRLGHALSDRSKNIVIIASEEAPVISETMIDVHSLSKRFDIRVFGYPIMRDLDNLDPKYFFDLDLMLYSPYWIDYSKKNVLRFNTAYRQKFLTEPTENSYAWQGYDITYYFMSGLAIYGKEFVRHPEIHRPELLQTDFDFERNGEDNGFENRNLFLIRYSQDYELKLVQ